MIVIFYLIIGLVGLGYLRVKRRYNYWTERGFQSPTSFFPFGSLKDGANKNSFQEIDEIYRKFKGKTPAVGVYFFMKPAIVPIDLELCKNILVRDFASFHDRDFYVNKEDEPTSAK
jgi:cytochrome P450 family 6